MSARRLTVRWTVPVAALLAALAPAACGDTDEPGVGDVAVPGRDGAVKTAAVVRARRRAFDGAPPVVPHPLSGSGAFAAACATCHSERGMAVEGLGFAPPSPHGSTPGMAVARCEQCHVEQQTEQLFVPTEFEGRPQDLRAGARAHAEAPPVMPHRLFMHEQCAACHAGPAAREELRTTHPERASCLQCHLEVRATSAFVR